MNRKLLNNIYFIGLIIIISFALVACTNTPSTNDKTSGIPDELLVGIITQVNGDNISIDVLTEGSAVSDKTVLTITDSTTFDDDSYREFNKGDKITFVITGMVLESYPTQTTAKRIVLVEKSQ